MKQLVALMEEGELCSHKCQQLETWRERGGGGRRGGEGERSGGREEGDEIYFVVVCMSTVNSHCLGSGDLCRPLPS